MTPTNRALAGLFSSIADLLEGRQSDTNPHRIRAYRKAAERLSALEEDIADVAGRGDLQEIPGIGRELAAKIHEFLQTGTITSYEQLRRPLPPEVRSWCSLPGLSESLVQLLYFRWGIRTLPDLESLVRSHLLRSLPGIQIPEETLLEAIRRQTAESP